MTLKSDAKFEGKMICSLENDMMNDLSTPSSENFHFDLFLLCKVFNIFPKKVDTSYLS